MTYDPLRYHNNLGGNEELIHIGVDLDGCLAEDVYPSKGIGEPIWETVEWVRKQYERGYKIIIYTSRASSEYKDIELWLRDHGIPFKWIHCGKPLMKLYVDDRAWCPPWLGKEDPE